MSARRIIGLVVLLVLLAAAGLVMLLPRQVNLVQEVAIKAPSNAVVRSLAERDKWQQWWPATDTALHYRQQNFSAEAHMDNSLLVDVPAGDSTISSLLMAIGVSRDSTLVSWTATLPTGANPLQRLAAWKEARGLKRQFSEVLDRLKRFAEDPRNVYGIPVKDIKVTTPYLVALKAETNGYPSTREVYAQIDKLRAYIQSAGARAVAPPMLNIEQGDSIHYSFMVAIPTDQLLPDKGEIKQKRMVLGRILESEVRGGEYTVRRGLEELENYKQDYKRQSPAIPFMSLTTDRTKEPDTTKWVTHLYYPVF